MELFKMGQSKPRRLVFAWLKQFVCHIPHSMVGCIPLYGCTKPSKKWRKKVVSKNILIFSFYHKYGVKVLHNSKYYDVLEL